MRAGAGNPTPGSHMQEAKVSIVLSRGRREAAGMLLCIVQDVLVVEPVKSLLLVYLAPSAARAGKGSAAAVRTGDRHDV